MPWLSVEKQPPIFRGFQQNRPFSGADRPIDKNSAALLKILINNENIVSLQLTASGSSNLTEEREQAYLSVTLVDARISDISRQNGNASSTPVLQETIRFDHDEITLHFRDTGDIITDRWDE